MIPPLSIFFLLAYIFFFCINNTPCFEKKNTPLLIIVGWKPKKKKKNAANERSRLQERSQDYRVSPDGGRIRNPILNRTHPNRKKKNVVSPPSSLAFKHSTVFLDRGGGDWSVRCEILIFIWKKKWPRCHRSICYGSASTWSSYHAGEGVRRGIFFHRGFRWWRKFFLVFIFYFFFLLLRFNLFWISLSVLPSLSHPH